MGEAAVIAISSDTKAAAEAHEARVAQALNAQYEQLRDQAQALFAAVRGQRGIRREEDWQRIFEQVKLDQASGRFLIERLGAQRYLEPELMATLAQLRTELLADIGDPTAADRMMADSAVLAYRNMLRVQSWICSISVVIERELFGQAPLSELHGPSVGNRLEEQIGRLEQRLLPLLDRCHRMMARSLSYLDGRQDAGPATSRMPARDVPPAITAVRSSRVTAS